MKFLVTVTSRIGSHVPKVTDPGKLLAEAQKWNDACLKNGTFDCSYGFTSGRGGIAIVNAASHEALMSTLRQSPMFHYVDYEVDPVCPMNVYYQIHLDALKLSN